MLILLIFYLDHMILTHLTGAFENMCWMSELKVFSTDVAACFAQHFCRSIRSIHNLQMK